MVTLTLFSSRKANRPGEVDVALVVTAPCTCSDSSPSNVTNRYRCSISQTVGLYKTFPLDPTALFDLNLDQKSIRTKACSDISANK